MTNSSIVTQDISFLLDQWIEAEQNGVEFPVPFEMAYPMAGYSRKDNAKRSLPKTALGILYLSSRIENKGRPLEQLNLSLEGLKHLCLMADTPEGYQIRQYFIDAEKKWKLTQQIAPAVAEEVEVLAMKIELAKIERDKAALEDKTLSLRDFIVRSQRKQTADRILGVTEITETVVKEIVVNERGQIIGHVPGDSYNKRELCERYELFTRTGKPDYRQLNAYLEHVNLPSEAWDNRQVVTHNPQVRAEYLGKLDQLIGKAPKQKGLGE